jgi:ABC-2 type transport system ATP-binding protein
MDDIAIQVEGVSKTFKLPHEKQGSIKSALINFRRSNKGYEKQRVLRNISFEVHKGEFFGIVGRNGSGKSTLLKLLAGIYKPDAGVVTINGSLTPFIELGVGFNHALTGKENVFLNGALLGFNRREMEAMYPDIVKFAELENFMDQKLKNYSSGMQVRLAFSIAIRANSGIIILDEVLAVGDAAFQQKCFEVFSDLKKRGTTIVLVTHDMSAVLRFCDRAMLISDGEIIIEGKPGDVAEKYLALNYEQTESEHADSKQDDPPAHNLPTINSAIISNAKGVKTSSFDPGDLLQAELSFENPTNKSIHFGFQIYTSDADVYCFGTNSKIAGLDPIAEKTGKVTISTKLSLVPGNYYITVATLNDSATALHHYRSKIAEFRIKKKTQQEGVALMEHNWRIPGV